MIWRRLKKKTPEEEEEFRKNVEKEGLEKKDMTAMILSAFLIIFPIALVVIGIMVLLSFIFFR